MKSENHETHRDGPRPTGASLRANNRIGSDDDSRRQRPEESLDNLGKIQELLFGMQFREHAQRISHLEELLTRVASELKHGGSKAITDLHEPTTSTPPRLNGNLEELQELLLAAERGRLDQLEGALIQLDDHIKNKVVDAPAVANVLPDAIRQRMKQDQHLEKSLVPIIDKTFVRATKSSAQLIAEAISPVIMPAIRKAMETTVQGMARSINQMLDRSGLSWRMLAWRWEAWRTGKAFGEVVLAHTVKYQVERVFLYFREDGIHLADVHLPSVPAFEPGHEDLVSSMFSAILTAMQKFARDELQASEQMSMNSFVMDDNKQVLIEYGAKAILVAVVRGIPSQSLRLALQDAVDSIHLELSEVLQNFRGDKKAFDAAKPYLESCLLQEGGDFSDETGAASYRLSPVFVVILLLPVIWLAWWGVTSYLERQRWAEFQHQVRGTPGIHITSINSAGGKNGKTIVYGLRDSLSDEPRKIAQEVGLSAEAIDFRLEPYLSLAPELLKRRTRERLDQLIQEIETHQLEFEAGSSSLAAESGVALQPVLQKLREGDTLAQQLGERLRVEIHGNTTEEGPVDLNQRLALARAQGILSVLKVEQFSATDFLAVSEAGEPSAIGESQRSKAPRARRVSFHVTIYDSGLARPRQ